MRNKSIALVFILGFTCATHVHAKASLKMASEAAEIIDPKKKKAGEECKTSDECQRHHACAPAGEKNVCTAPPRPKHKPGVVT